GQPTALCAAGSTSKPLNGGGHARSAGQPTVGTHSDRMNDAKSGRRQEASDAPIITEVLMQGNGQEVEKAQFLRPMEGHLWGLQRTTPPSLARPSADTCNAVIAGSGCCATQQHLSRQRRGYRTVPTPVDGAESDRHRHRKEQAIDDGHL